MRQVDTYKKIAGLIQTRDAREPILSSAIENMLHVTGPTVRETVRAMRRRGDPVIATEFGYYMATRPEEVQIVIRDLTARISSLSKTVTAIRSKAYERFGQQSCFEFGPSKKEVPGVIADGPDSDIEDRSQESKDGGVLSVQAHSGAKEPGDIRPASPDGSLDELLREVDAELVAA